MKFLSAKQIVLGSLILGGSMHSALAVEASAEKTNTGEYKALLVSVEKCGAQDKDGVWHIEPRAVLMKNFSNLKKPLQGKKDGFAVDVPGVLQYELRQGAEDGQYALFLTYASKDGSEYLESSFNIPKGKVFAFDLNRCGEPGSVGRLEMMVTLKTEKVK